MKIFYGLTPPRNDYSSEKLADISGRRLERLQSLPVDGLILYDVQEESARTSVPRPFPWTPVIPPLEWDRNFLAPLKLERIYYRPVGMDSPESLIRWMQAVNASGGSMVFVGAASRNQKVFLALSDAYRLRAEKFPDLPLGGIFLPERHTGAGSEHLRMMGKMEMGCSFFVSQCIYDVQTTLNCLSDWYYLCREQNRPLVPVYFTLTPCGSLQTLGFMKWLGIGIPRWMENDLSVSGSILDVSVEMCLLTARTLSDFCRNKGIPYGFNVESVSLKKEEIEASGFMVRSLRSEAEGN